MLPSGTGFQAVNGYGPRGVRWGILLVPLCRNASWEVKAVSQGTSESSSVTCQVVKEEAMRDAAQGLCPRGQTCRMGRRLPLSTPVKWMIISWLMLV